MASQVVFFAWNRAIPGRERISAAHFDDFVAFLEGKKKGGKIEGYDTVFLDAHGGDLNGFFLIRGEAAQLDALVGGEDWQEHMVRALMHLQGSGAVRGLIGAGVAKRMEMWKKSIPS